MPTFAGESGPRVIRAAHLDLEWAPVDPAQVVSGDPRIGSAEVAIVSYDDAVQIDLVLEVKDGKLTARRK